jgi:hypothetical protein
MTLARAPVADVQPQLTTRLPDWFEAIYDPDGVIARHLLRLDQLAAKRGVRLYPQTDFRALKAVVEARRNLGTVLMPHVDPTYSTIGEENGFWILGIDEQGNVATTQAARYYDFSGSSLAQELRSFRFFYDEPGRFITSESYCRPPVEAESINGPALASGTLWVRSDLRGPDEEGTVLSGILPTMNRLIAIAKWWPKFFFTFSSYELYKRGVVRNFGFPHEAFGMEWQLHYGPVPTSGLFWMTREEMLGWAAEDIKQPAAA